MQVSLVESSWHALFGVMWISERSHTVCLYFQTAKKKKNHLVSPPRPEAIPNPPTDSSATTTIPASSGSRLRASSTSAPHGTIIPISIPISIVPTHLTCTSCKPPCHWCCIVFIYVHVCVCVGSTRVGDRWGVRRAGFTC